jgi:gamma-glutamyl:cysteine ligase YbdK (ATP-grasp superfamily)
VIEQHFGESAPFSLGVEEELMILDAATLEQVAAVDRIIAGVASMQLPGQIKTCLLYTLTLPTT